MSSAAPISKSRFRFRLAVSLLVVLCARSVLGLSITNVSIVNVTPSGFSVVWAASPGTTPTINVYADPAGATNLAGQVGIEWYPLHTGDPTLTNAYYRRQNQTLLRQAAMNQGVVQARVSLCEPNTRYYYSLQVATTNGQTAVWPTTGPLPAVTTALENDFVVQSLQLVLTMPDSNPAGSIVILSNTNTSSLLSGVVGDGVASNEVYFSVSDMLAANGKTNYLFSGEQSFIATVLGDAARSLTQNYSVTLSSNFLVGGLDEFVTTQQTSISFGSAIISIGKSGSVPINLSSAGLSNLSFVLNFPTNLFSSLALQASSPQLGSATLQSAGPNSMLVSFAAVGGQTLQGSQQLAQLNFTAQSNESSAFVPLAPQSLQAFNADGTIANSVIVQRGRVVIIGREPLLDSLMTGGARRLALYGIPGNSYQIQSTTNWGATAVWTDVERVPMTNQMELLSGINESKPIIFYRAYQFTTLQPILDALPSAGNLEKMVLYGTPGLGYEVEYTAGLGSGLWDVLERVQLTNSFQFITGLSTGVSDVFYDSILLSSNPPSLDVEPLVNGRETLMIYGAPWGAYEVDYKTNLSSSTWSLLARVPLTNGYQTIAGLNTRTPDVFYRIIPLNADPPIITPQAVGPNHSLLVYGLPGTNYSLQYATNFSKTVTWYPLLSYRLTNSFQTLTNLGTANPSIFYRLKKQ